MQQPRFHEEFSITFPVFFFLLQLRLFSILAGDIDTYIQLTNDNTDKLMVCHLILKQSKHTTQTMGIGYSPERSEGSSATSTWRPASHGHPRWTTEVGSARRRRPADLQNQHISRGVSKPLPPPVLPDTGSAPGELLAT